MKSTHGVDIEATSKACGLSPGVLRIWELRYGWPNPVREANGYRIYSPWLVEDLKRMADLVRRGHKVGDMIADGHPRWPAVELPSRTAPDFARMHLLPDVASEGSTRYLRQIRIAVVGRLEGHLNLLLRDASAHLHPRDRSSCAWLPALLGLAAWDIAGRPLPCANDVRWFIRDQVGAVGWAGLMEHVNAEVRP